MKLIGVIFQVFRVFKSIIVYLNININIKSKYTDIGEKYMTDTGPASEAFSLKELLFQNRLFGLLL